MQSNEEIWKDLPYCNYYQVSNLGNARSKDRPYKYSKKKFLKAKSVALTNNGNGYRLFGTSVDGRKKNFYIHRVVAQLFLPNPNNLPEVNHKDGDKTNNRVSNLEWVSMEDNREHAVLNNLVAHGESNGLNKLTERQIREILLAAQLNPLVNRTRLGEQYGIGNSVVCRIISGKRWRRTWEKFHSESRLAKTEPHKI